MTRSRTSSEPRPSWWLRAAELAGTIVRRLADVRPYAAGAAGAACVCWGLGLIYPPLALVAAGVFLLWLDGRS
ncbi:hypothetical protein [Nonomuraea sp. NPDC049758]|uniref:hypothetical protein n=1 Tax=Nonomuraea sp. NPDC049758 TaxID=3154360 RepID=UPI003425D4C1